MLILGSTILFSQEPLFRGQSPAAAKIGSGGVGIDVSLGNRLGADATTWVLSSSFSVRYYFWERNGSPFIGIGVGKANGGFGGGGDNTWTVAIAGWEHSYKVFLIQIGLQAPIVTQNSYGYKPFLVSLNIGARIF
jgi:hypothetical protein